MRFPMLLAFLSAALPLRAALKPAELAFFEKEVRPLLAEHCYQCHSQEASRLKGGLLLDSAAGWQMGGDSGEALIPGDPDASLLMHAVRYDNRDLQMPPKYKLSEDAVAVLEKWIAMGAPDPREGEAHQASVEIDIEARRDFWAFQKPQPTPNKETIDAFVEARLHDASLKAAPLADRRTLIRRASFDLVGLPPSPRSVAAFVRDSRPDREAFAAVVDDLLASSGFGERWGRHWLDVVRYGESMGRTRNFPFPYAWRYRDYVIDAFNEDKPYDVFVREQLAGDLLPAESDAERDRLTVATGFLAMGSLDLNERNREQYRMDRVDEQIDVTGRAVLGLTTGCARCHDHKFDPIPQTDYFALAGIFRSTDTFSGYQSRQGGNRGGFYPELLVSLASVPAEVVAKEEQAVDPQARRRLRNQQQQLAKVNRELKALGKDGGNRRGRALAKLRERQKSLQRSIAKTRRLVNNPPRGKKNPTVDRTANYAMGVREAEKIEDCRVNVRGEANNLGDRVPRGFLQVLCEEGESQLPTTEQSGRLELAHWLTSPENPLTARVMVNRLWHHLLGHGLVRTVDNFGDMGERPSHPALLDHLALRFVEHDWSVKTMVREIMLSETYRRSSAHLPEADAVDPENRLLWRAHVRRLQAEPLRDAILAISGQLERERPEGSPLYFATSKAMRQAAQRLDKAWRNRRAVYLPVVRGFLPGFFQVFDFAEPSQVMGRRDITTVPTQALYFMNDTFVMDQARMAAQRLLQARAEDRLGAAYRWTLGRPPTPEERESSRAFLHDPDIADKPQGAWAGLFQALFASAEFRYLR